MVPAQATESRAARAPAARKLTLSDAIDQWERTTLAIEGLKPLQKQAAEVLIDHGQRTGRRTFKNRIVMEQTGGSSVLDQPAAVQFILAAGRKLADFQKTTKLGWTLKLLR